MILNSSIKYRLISNTKNNRKIDMVGDSPENLIELLLTQLLTKKDLDNLWFNILQFEELTIKHEEILFANFTMDNTPWYEGQKIKTGDYINHKEAFISKEKRKIYLNNIIFWNDETCKNAIKNHPLYGDIETVENCIDENLLNDNRQALDNIRRLINENLVINED